MSDCILLFLPSLRMLCYRPSEDPFTARPSLAGRFSLTMLCNSALTLNVTVEVIEPMVSSARWAVASVASDEVSYILAPTSSITAVCLCVSSTRHASFSRLSLAFVRLRLRPHLSSCSLSFSRYYFSHAPRLRSTPLACTLLSRSFRAEII